MVQYGWWGNIVVMVKAFPLAPTFIFISLYAMDNNLEIQKHEVPLNIFDVVWHEMFEFNWLPIVVV